MQRLISTVVVGVAVMANIGSCDGAVPLLSGNRRGLLKKASGGVPTISKIAGDRNLLGDGVDADNLNSDVEVLDSQVGLLNTEPRRHLATMPNYLDVFLGKMMRKYQNSGYGSFKSDGDIYKKYAEFRDCVRDCVAELSKGNAGGQPAGIWAKEWCENDETLPCVHLKP